MKTIDNDDIQSDDNDDDESATSHRNVGPSRVVNISLIMYNEHIKLHYPDRPFTIAHRQEHLNEHLNPDRNLRPLIDTETIPCKVSDSALSKNDQ